MVWIWFDWYGLLLLVLFGWLLLCRCVSRLGLFECVLYTCLFVFLRGLIAIGC